MEKIKYKILNLLFGWDYVYWAEENSNGIGRVFVSKDHRVCFWQISRRFDKLVLIMYPEKIIWLTCSPDKYFPKKEATDETERKES